MDALRSAWQSIRNATTRSGSRRRAGWAGIAFMWGLSASAAPLPNGVAAGDVTATSAVLWARAGIAGPFAFEYGTDRTFSTVAARAETEVRDVTVPAKVRVFDLTPGTTFYYRATDSAGNSSTGTFHTPAASGKAGLRFGVSGDFRGDLAPFVSIRNIPERRLDFFANLGDTIYADLPSPALGKPAVTLPEQRAKHDEVLSSRDGLNLWAEARSTTALYAVIDDHEVVDDFAGGQDPASDPRFAPSALMINETQRYRDAVQAFLDYMPLREDRYGATGDRRTAGKVKFYRAQAYGQDAAVFLVDARSFRDAPLPPVTSANLAKIKSFLDHSRERPRTMLGHAQLDLLKQDLVRAQQAGITWKFVLLPEPIQNLGLAGASDRFEGYAAERDDLLAFVAEQDIQNVVFVSADVHGTLVNDLGYQPSPRASQMQIKAWEITTGPVAYSPPFGPATIRSLVAAGLLGEQQKRLYDRLPVRNDADDIPNDKDDFVRLLINTELSALGYSRLGLDDSAIDASLLAGDFISLHTYGWTEFDVDAATQRLTVTTYGVDAYSPQELAADPKRIATLQPRVVSRFELEADHVAGAARLPDNPEGVARSAAPSVAGGRAHWMGATR